ncbi:MAG: hypothetical protein ACXVAX_06735, partial [Pseudobdellovibrio sp.]
NTLPTIIDPSSKTLLRTFTETEADHDFATEMFTEGLMTGDLMKAATGLHTLEDSFAHAGTIAELGHAHFWHHPDRPYVDDASVEKYFQMTRSVLRGMVAIRSLLPANGIDTQVKFGDKPNYQLNGDELADIYSQVPDVRKAVSRRILNEPSFVQFALNNVFVRAQKANYVKDGYQGYLNNFTPGQDTYQAAGSVVKTMPQEMINVSQILHDEGRPNLSAEYIVSLGGLSSLLSHVVNDLLTGIVPRPLDVYHRFEKEEDGPVWIKEMDLRVGNMRALIKRLYDKDIYFVENKTKDDKGYIKEITHNPAAEVHFPASTNGVEYVSYSGAEKYKFDNMIFTFLFPNLSNYLKGDLAQIDNLSQLIVKAQDGSADDETIMQRVMGIYTAATGLLRNINIFSDLRNEYKLARKDILESHLVPQPNNHYYAVPYLLRREIDRKVFKPLMSPQDVDALVNKR